jgi:hypothetical protein
MDRTAQISECGLYRYELTRRWEAGPDCTFIMLNPSTADAELDDPTIRRCIGFCRLWGYGGLRVVNLYAYRSTKPRDLFAASHPFGSENVKYLQAAVNESALLVAAWGGWSVPDDAASILEGVPMICLGHTKSGSPRHPLYVKYAVEPCQFTLTSVPERPMRSGTERKVGYGQG